MEKFDEEAFFADVASVSWERVVSVTNDIDSMVETWSDLFSSILENTLQVEIEEFRIGTAPGSTLISRL